MVANHWSNDAIVTIHRSSLTLYNLFRLCLEKSPPQWQIHSNEYGPRVHLPGEDLLAWLCDDDRVEDEVHQPQPVARLFWLRHLGLARGRRQASGSAISP